MSECDICNENRVMAVINVEGGDYGEPNSPLYSHVGKGFVIELSIPTPENMEFDGSSYPVLEIEAWPCGLWEGEKRQNQAVPIRYCPMCGRKLAAE